MVTFEHATAGEFIGNAKQREEKSFFSWKHDHFEMVAYKNADRTPVRWRRNGATKTWKTRPGHFRIPVKHGLYDYGYIDHENADQFVVAD